MSQYGVYCGILQRRLSGGGAIVGPQRLQERPPKLGSGTAAVNFAPFFTRQESDFLARTHHSHARLTDRGLCALRSVHGLDRRAYANDGRMMPAGGPGRIEVFDEQGIRVGFIELLPRSRVIGFGEGTDAGPIAYLARTDDVGLIWLEQYGIRRAGE